MSKYVIIAENDVSKWDDETGARYHFPNKYIKLLQSGAKVIYYKGRYRSQDKAFEAKRLSKDPHYFGSGEIGDVYPDKSNERNSFAEIENYQRFEKAVHFKDSRGEYIEDVKFSNKLRNGAKQTNHFRNGVRKTNIDIYNKILKEAGFQTLDNVNVVELDDEIDIELAENDLLISRVKKENPDRLEEPRAYYGPNLKEIGDLGENIVIKYLKKNLSKEEAETIRWVAAEGVTPGYDIEYTDSKREKICIEVKSTTAKKLPYFNFTINEKQAAERIDNYYIYLVSEVKTKNPKIQIIESPFSKENKGNWDIEPVVFKVYKVE